MSTSTASGRQTKKDRSCILKIGSTKERSYHINTSNYESPNLNTNGHKNSLKTAHAKTKNPLI